MKANVTLSSTFDFRAVIDTDECVVVVGTRGTRCSANKFTLEYTITSDNVLYGGGVRAEGRKVKRDGKVKNERVIVQVSLDDLPSVIREKLNDAIMKRLGRYAGQATKLYETEVIRKAESLV